MPSRGLRTEHGAASPDWQPAYLPARTTGCLAQALTAQSRKNSIGHRNLRIHGKQASAYAVLRGPSNSS